ncbi:Crp/Fnr family transcriptional regulator [Sphingomonas sp. ABOLG]|jgi:CRP-like cAMP-binding protein|uniref:Crp/Fnr family transcriptional regulator n=1 Tax=Sphingomonas sp. ABOLG TaxID=1985880 RepID=UPI000F7E7497|nr:Crp/Fnr family transcriptional regulator [Sphingomonas sp. ABOLG]RSV17331.1 Crp/Fnr family transcriptional regulator [Sphingomonas sp. ABOLG]
MAEGSRILGEALRALAGGPLPELEAIEGRLVTLDLPRGGTLFRQGEPEGSVWFVASGLVKLSYEDAAGRVLTKSIVEEGGLFASIAAVAGGEASFTAAALTPLRVERSAWTALEALAARHHPWETALRTMLMQYARQKEVREHEVLTLSATERWLRLLERRPAVCARLPQTELAALIGITPVALSRIKARLGRSSRGSGTNAGASPQPRRAPASGAARGP